MLICLRKFYPLILETGSFVTEIRLECTLFTAIAHPQQQQYLTQPIDLPQRMPQA